MLKKIVALFLFSLVVGSAVYYGDHRQDQEVGRVVQSQSGLEGLLEIAQDNCATLMISSEDDQPHFVAPNETLGAAMARGSVATTTYFEQERGFCVREDSENPPDEGQEACKCFEKTGCDGGESSTCKRHCKRSLCKCCPGT